MRGDGNVRPEGGAEEERDVRLSIRRAAGVMRLSKALCLGACGNCGGRADRQAGGSACKTGGARSKRGVNSVV